ncbi:MAG TPA: hypothetical protein GX715_09135 [Armatimonadetes bacterium]|nr:hypothetical protein [Armatimonadota bacterium]
MLRLLAFLVLLLSTGPVLAQDAVLVAPRCPDPPPSVDGRLGEWQASRWGRVIETRQHATFGAEHWKGAGDLSARVWFGWDAANLYLAADVRDDVVEQSLRAGALFRGDHIELFVRTRPESRPAERFTEEDWQFGFSPGNFSSTGDRLADIAPEGVVFWPANTAVEGMRVAALRTEAGYTLEASIPLAALGVKPEVGQELAVEVAISDSDGGSGQQTLLTLATAPWKLRDPGRLLPLRFADAAGNAPARSGAAFSLFAEARLEPGKEEQWRITVPDPAEVPGGKDAVLAVKARLESAKLAGGTGALQVWLNGTLLDETRLVSRPRVMQRETGGALTSYALAFGAFVFYSPDYEQGTRGGTPYSVVEGAMYDLEFRAGDLLRAGENEVRIRHGRPQIPNALVLAEARLKAAGKSYAVAIEPEVAPEGELPVIVPQKLHRVSYSARIARGGGIHLRVGGVDLVISSRFSQEGGAWNELGDRSAGFAKVGVVGLTATATARDYTLSRRITLRDELIEVHDTLANTSGRDIALMMRHEVPAAAVKALRLSGLPVPARTGSADEPAHPTIFLDLGRAGLGLMAFDDVFRVHSTVYCLGGVGGLADNHFVLGAGKKHTAIWWILPQTKPDYFAMVNALRRAQGTNFTLPWGFAFVPMYQKTLERKPEELAAFARNKGAHVLCGTIPKLPNGKYAHGTALPSADLRVPREVLKAFKAVTPGARTMMYYHTFISTEDDAPAKYTQDALRDPSGKQYDYGQSIYPLFYPTLENAYGRAMRQNVEILLGKVGAEGIYWDEMEYSRYQYTYGAPWDGVSADIDPKTHQVIRKKSSVVLLTQPFKVAIAKGRLLDRGVPLIANGQPHTWTMTQLHFPRFVETGSLTHLVRSHLYCPIGLGDHLTERTEADVARQVCAHLDYGALYYWYSGQIMPTHPNLTSFMFPFTPVELQEGYVIGKERILANRSGLYGWDDASRHEVHIFDREGRETTKFPARQVEREGKTFTELRIPKGYTAAIIRVGAAAKPAP